MRWGGFVMVGLSSSECVMIVVEFLKPMWTIYRDDPGVWRGYMILWNFMELSLNPKP